MKQFYFFLFIIPAVLFSCNDNDYDEIKTSIPVTMSIEVNEPTALNQKSGQTDYSYTATKTFYLSDNEDVKDYLNNMKYISVKGYSGGISGLSDGDTIKTEIIVGDNAVLCAFEDITNSSSGTQLQDGHGAFATIEDVLLSEKQLTVNVTGTTNKAPMNFDIDMLLRIAVFVK